MKRKYKIKNGDNRKLKITKIIEMFIKLPNYCKKY